MAEISGRLREEETMVWLDLRDPDEADLVVISEEFGFHPLAIEGAVHGRQRPKVDRYRTHLFLNAYGVRLDTGSGDLATSEVAAFVTDRTLISRQTR